MKKIFYLLTIASIMISCTKNSEANGSFAGDVEESVSIEQTIEAAELSPGVTMYDEFNERFALAEMSKLTSENAAHWSMIAGDFLSIVRDRSEFDDTVKPAEGTTDKQFNNNIWGKREAAQYGGGIMEAGGCIKVWYSGQDNEFINVIEIPC